MSREPDLKTRPVGRKDRPGGERPGGGPEGSGSDPAGELRNVILVGWPSADVARLLDVVHAVAPDAAVRRTRGSQLRFSPLLPAGTLLVLPDRLDGDSGVDFLRLLRSQGIDAPAIVLGEREPAVPDDLEALGALDLQPLAAFSAFSLRRAIRIFGDETVQQRLLEEMSSRFRAYEQVLESKDDERLRVLQVASALERQLAASERKLERLESAAEEEELLRGILDLDPDGDEPLAPARVRPPDERVPPALLSPAGAGALGAAPDPPPAAGGGEGLRRLVAQSATAGDLATRLEASERIRRAQTREMLNQQRVIAELEQRIEDLAELLDARRHPETADPGEVLAELEARLARFEKIRDQQQSTIVQLSRTLAMQQVDNTLDNAHSRRNVLRRVEEAERRSRRSGTPLTCMMIAIDHPRAIREEHGSVLYDYLLVQVAQRLQVALRHRDVLLRYGDEAFVLLTDAESGARARPHAERLLWSVCEEPLDLGARRVRPSISVAILHHRPEMSGAGELIRVTMKRLIGAQREGERQIVAGPEPEGGELEEETQMFEAMRPEEEEDGDEEVDEHDRDEEIVLEEIVLEVEDEEI